MKILVINCGSSSLKYQLLDMKNEEVYDLLAKGLVERIGLEVGCLKHQTIGKDQVIKEMPIEDHTVGIKAVIAALLDKEAGVLSTLEDIEAVGHRVVHGAEDFVCSQLITDQVVAQLEKCSVFAPLHNPANILGIKAVSAVLIFFISFSVITTPNGIPLPFLAASRSFVLMLIPHIPLS